MRRIQSLLPLFATLLVLYGLVRLFRIAQQYDPSNTENGGSAGIDVAIRLNDAVLVSREQGKPRWKLRATRIELHPQPYGGLDSFQSAEFTGIRDGQLFRDGKQEATFFATRATFEQASQRFDISGGLSLKTRKGDSMTAEECVWSEAEDFVRLPRGGTGVFNGYRLKAPLLLYEPKKRLVQCPQGGEAERKGESVRAASIMWDVEAGHVHCMGPVSGTRGAISYTVQSLSMDAKKNTMKANNGIATVRIESEDQHPEGVE
jgi:hypothetical protein